MSEVIPLVTYNQKGIFCLQKGALDFLETIEDEKLAVISIMGKYRTGQSYLVNKMLLQQSKNGFQVGPTINACTKGLWISKKLLRLENSDHQELRALVIDCEGLGSYDQTSSQDNRIFMLALLISSFLIYNDKNVIDEQALNNISLIVNIAQEIQMQTQSQHHTFPFLMWVMRDFSLQLLDPKGNAMTPKEYLESALEPQKGLSQSIENKNRVRRLLKTFFVERDCATIVRPFEDELNFSQIMEMDDQQFRPQFLEDVNCLKSKILKQSKPQVLQGKFVTGGVIIQLLKAYIDIINIGGVPNSDNAWNMVITSNISKVVKRVEEFIDKKFAEFQVLPESQVCKKELLGVIENIIKKEILDQDPQLQQQLMTEFQAKLKVQICAYEEQFNDKMAKLIESEIKIILNRMREGFFLNSDQTINTQQIFNYVDEIFNKITLRKSIDGQSTGSPQASLFSSFYKNIKLLIENLCEKTREIYSADLMVVSNQYENTIKLKEQSHEQLQNQLFVSMENLEKSIGINDKQISKLTMDNNLLTKSLENAQINIEQANQSLAIQRNIQTQYLNKLNALKNSHDSQHQKVLNLESTIESINQQLNATHSLLQQYKAKQHDDENLVDNLKNEIKSRENEWEIERKYFENQHQFLKSQLSESKSLNESLVQAIQSGIQAKNEEKDSNHVNIIEANQSLMLAYSKSEERCGALEEKLQNYRLFQQIFNSSKSIQCSNCSGFYLSKDFSTHQCEKVLKNNNQLQQVPPTLVTNHSHITETPSSANDDISEIMRNLAQKEGTDAYINLNQNELFLTIYQSTVNEKISDRPFTEYRILIQLRGLEWAVIRQYKDFHELHNILMNQNPGIELPESAIMAIISIRQICSESKTSQQSTLLEQRKNSLEMYLKDLCSIDEIRNSRIFQRFIDIHRQKDSLESNYESFVKPMPSQPSSTQNSEYFRNILNQPSPQVSQVSLVKHIPFTSKLNDEELNNLRQIANISQGFSGATVGTNVAVVNLISSQNQPVPPSQLLQNNYTCSTISDTMNYSDTLNIASLSQKLEENQKLNTFQSSFNNVRSSINSNASTAAATGKTNNEDCGSVFQINNLNFNINHPQNSSNFNNLSVVSNNGQIINSSLLSENTVFPQRTQEGYDAIDSVLKEPLNLSNITNTLNQQHLQQQQQQQQQGKFANYFKNLGKQDSNSGTHGYSSTNTSSNYGPSQIKLVNSPHVLGEIMLKENNYLPTQVPTHTSNLTTKINERRSSVNNIHFNIYQQSQHSLQKRKLELATNINQLCQEMKEHSQSREKQSKTFMKNLGSDCCDSPVQQRKEFEFGFSAKKSLSSCNNSRENILHKRNQTNDFGNNKTIENYNVENSCSVLSSLTNDNYNQNRAGSNSFLSEKKNDSSLSNIAVKQNLMKQFINESVEKLNVRKLN